MRDHQHFASVRRDDRLSRIRKLTLWVGGSAAAASLGLGTAFAHALPGHSATTPTSPTKTAASAGSTGSSGQATGSATSPSPGTSQPRHHRQHSTLAQPKQTPAPAPAQAPPVVSSGGS